MQIKKTIQNVILTLSSRSYNKSNQYYLFIKSNTFEVRLSANTLSELLTLFTNHKIHYNYVIVVKYTNYVNGLIQNGDIQ